MARVINLAALERRAALGGGLRSFVRRAWALVVPEELQWNWHHDLIVEALERAARGDARKLSIWVPPGTTKTLLVDVFFPAWVWTFRPSSKFIFATYGGRLALDAARKMRALVLSDWYQRITEGSVKLDRDNVKQAGWFENTAHGFRFSGSVGGEVTGRHADFLIGDDLNKAIDALGQPTAFARSWEFWSQVLPTRQSDPKRTVRIQIGQRLHIDDVGGQWSREDSDVEVLCLPMHYSATHPHMCAADPRTEEGELLWPEHYGAEEVVELERSLGPSQASAQLEQRPLPPGGQLLRAEYLEHRWAALPSTMQRALESGRAGPGQSWGIYVDATFKGKATSDFVTIQLWCRFSGRYYLIDQERGQWGFRATKRRLRDFLSRYPVAPAIHVEDAANAAALEDDLKRELPIVLEPVGGGCLARTQRAEGLWASGAVLLPERADWLGGSDGFVAEHMGYDGAGTRHDDQVAASSLALVGLSGDHGGRWAAAWARVARQI